MKTKPTDLLKIISHRLLDYRIGMELILIFNYQRQSNRWLRHTLIAIIMLAFLGSLSCKRIPPASEQEKAVAKCLQELNSIPQMAALLKARSKETGEAESSSLKGMEIALTINGMIRSEGDSDKGVDSWCSKENSIENFDKLLDALKQNDMPPTVSFVVGRLFDQKMAEAWLQSGNLLGNMTFKPIKVKRKEAQKVIDDVAQNDEVLTPLWKQFPYERKYFRYPGLKLSDNVEARQQIQNYLKTNGYVEVPATINAQDGKFTESYCAAMDRGDQSCLNLINIYFKMLLLEITSKARIAARKAAGHEVKHILAVKANQFMCNNLADILAWYKNLGVKFIPLDEALSDPVYTGMDDKGKPVYRSIIMGAKRGKFADKK